MAEAVDPLERALSIGPRIPVSVAVIATVVALFLHGGAAFGAVQAALLHAFGAWAQGVRASVEGRLLQTYDVDVAKPEPPPPAKEEPKEEARPLVKNLPKDEPPPPPPAAAQAARVLTQEPAKDEPVDLTGNTFAQGNADTYAGGNTASSGTSKTAVYNPLASPKGVVGGTGSGPPGPAAPKQDRSRAARIGNVANLERCPFPAEADAEQIDQAVVGIDVKVRPDGAPESVSVWQDPGHGFGREARKCAMRETYVTALDVDGNAVPGVAKIRFRFTR